MAWTRATDFSSLLQSVKTWIYTSTFGVTGSSSSPTLTEAFDSDTVKVTKFAHGMWRFNMNNGFAPTRNYVDALQTIQTETGTSFFGAGAKVAEDGHVWYSTDAAFTKSGDKCLVVRNLVSPTTDDQLDLISAPFPVAAGQSYRISVRWTSDLAGTFMECGIRELDKDKGAIGLDSVTAGIVTPGTMQWDSGVVTMGATTTWGVLDLLKSPTSPVWNYYIDEIRIEPIQPSWQLVKTTLQSNVVAGDTLVTWDSTAFAYGTTANLISESVTILEPGRYLITVGFPMTCGTATESMGMKLAVNGASSYTIGGAEMARIGATVNANGSVILNLNRGDAVTVVANSSASTADIPANVLNGHFSGVRVA
jgi:hypothetical protein